MFYTERLMLRALEPDADLNLFTQWLNDVDYLAAISLHPPLASSKAGTKKFLEKIEQREGKMPFFVICEKPAPEEGPSSLGMDDNLFTKDGQSRYPFVGILSIGSPDDMHFATRIARFGIALDRKHQDRGYGTEVLNWATEYCFKRLGLHKIELDVDASNKRALHVYEKIGFVQEGVRRKRFWINGKWQDMVEMGLLEEEWFAKH